MNKYEQLLADLRTELRPQRAWGEGRGVFLVVGHFVVGVAAGTWLFALLFASRAGLVLALALAVLGGIVHLAFLGHPARAWRMAAHWRTSWISRGFLGLSAFLAGAVLHLWGQQSFVIQLGYALAAAGMVVLIGYMGFVYTASKAIPFWNSPLHPALYVAYALRGGVAALLVVFALEGGAHHRLVDELLVLWIVLTAVVALLFALEVHGALTGGSAAARRSVHELFAGRVALAFYGGTLALGLALPAWLAWQGARAAAPLEAMAALGVASALGDFFMKYATIRAGVHLPVWTRLTPQR